MVPGSPSAEQVGVAMPRDTGCRPGRDVGWAEDPPPHSDSLGLQLHFASDPLGMCAGSLCGLLEPLFALLALAGPEA